MLKFLHSFAQGIDQQKRHFSRDFNLISCEKGFFICIFGKLVLKIIAVIGVDHTVADLKSAVSAAANKAPLKISFAGHHQIN